MLVILRDVAKAIEEVLGPVADRLGRQVGFIRRQRKLSGSRFVRLLVGGWHSNPASSLSELCRVGTLCQVRLSAQGLAKRFTAAAAALLEGVLTQAARRVVMAHESVSLPLLERFAQVGLVDTTSLVLPAKLAASWPGTGGRTPTSNQAAMKVEVGLELKKGQ